MIGGVRQQLNCHSYQYSLTTADWESVTDYCIDFRMFTKGVLRFRSRKIGNHNSGEDTDG